MRPNPDPNNLFVALGCESAMVQAHAGGPNFSDPLEVQGRVARVLQKHLGAAIGQLLNLLRQGPVKPSESGACAVFHRSVQRPASKSSRASWISQSSRPAASSSAI